MAASKVAIQVAHVTAAAMQVAHATAASVRRARPESPNQRWRNSQHLGRAPTKEKARRCEPQGGWYVHRRWQSSRKRAMTSAEPHVVRNRVQPL
eukprot:2345357-Pleurochrysis_carterae.AAC.1